MAARGTVRAGIPAELRWGHWPQLQAGKALVYHRNVIFPWFRALGAEVQSLRPLHGQRQPQDQQTDAAHRACKLIDRDADRRQNQDVQATSTNTCSAG